ncbi:MAG: Amuc_1100 family pilus-like protein [Opitutaceae bacterium]|nr:Amuc_1100 family pilus-like protein [Opitutaceae bacterium]
MHRYHRYPVFYALLVVLALAFLGAGWGCYAQWKAAQIAQHRLESMRRDYRALARVSPALTEDVAGRIADDLTQSERSLASLRAKLEGAGTAVERIHEIKAPATRTDAFFNLAAFREEMREQARLLGVLTEADEGFGFSEYAKGGPDMNVIPAVLHQRQGVEYLLEALLASRPQRLVELQRERPRMAAPHNGPGMDRTTQDFFELDPRLSVRVPDYIEADAFRVVFTGYTSVLRTFLNKLVVSELPLVVRAVNVEPATKREAVPASIQPTGRLTLTDDIVDKSQPVPLIAPPLLKFTVTVEYLKLISVSLPGAGR